MLGVSHAHPCLWTHFATEESIEQRHIHDSSKTCVAQPAVLKWNQARALDRDWGTFPCPGGETCWELNISWLGYILETLDLVIVTQHTAPPPTLRKRERTVFGSDSAQVEPDEFMFSPQNREEIRQCLTPNINKSTRVTIKGFRGTVWCTCYCWNWEIKLIFQRTSVAIDFIPVSVGCVWKCINIWVETHQM